MHDDLIQFIEKKDLTQLRTAFRQAFMRSKYKKAFLDRHRVESPTYKKDGSLSKKISVDWECACCGEMVKSDNLNVDHIEPIGSFKSIEEVVDFFFRVFCAFDNLQILCKICHSRKTKYERMTFNKL